MKAERVVTLRNSKGLHARTAYLFSTCAQHFSASIRVDRCSANRGEPLSANGKEISDLLLMMAGAGDTLTISAHGEDAPEALAQLAALVESKFNDEDKE